MKLLRIIDRYLGLVSKLAVIFGGLILILLVGVTAIDVASRTFMNRGLSGAVEFSELAMIPLVFLVFGWNERSNSHISVDVVSQLVSARVQAIMFTTGRVLAVAALVFLTIATATAAFETLENKQAHYNAAKLLYWPFHFAVPLGFGLLTLEILFTQLRLLTGKPITERESLSSTPIPDHHIKKVGAS